MQNERSNIQLKRLAMTMVGSIEAVISVCALLFSSAAYAKVVPPSTIVFVDGRSGPWSIAANPGYAYANVPCCGGPDVHLGPTSVSSFTGFSFAAGNSLSIDYVSGLANAGGGGLYFDANGVPGWPADSGAPGQYITGYNNLMQLFGVFANSGGVIVDSPFVIGNGSTLAVIPNGATQLLMGFNDGWYTDNGAGLYMRVTGYASAAPVPEPETYAMLLAGLGMMGFMARRRKNFERVAIGLIRHPMRIVTRGTFYGRGCCAIRPPPVRRHRCEYLPCPFCPEFRHPQNI